MTNVGVALSYRYMATVLIYLFLLLIILLVFGTAAYAGLIAAPWLPVFKRDIRRVVQVADVQEGDVVYDLGSGDGRILLAIANCSKPRRIVGYEISFLLYIWSKLRIWFRGFGKIIEIRGDDFLSRDLSSAHVIFCFLTPKAMKKLAPKFKNELKKGTRIVSYSFSLPGWEPVEINRPDTKSMPIFKYIVD